MLSESVRWTVTKRPSLLEGGSTKATRQPQTNVSVTKRPSLLEGGTYYEKPSLLEQEPYCCIIVRIVQRTFPPAAPVV